MPYLNWKHCPGVTAGHQRVKASVCFRQSACLTASETPFFYWTGSRASNFCKTIKPITTKRICWHVVQAILLNDTEAYRVWTKSKLLHKIVYCRSSSEQTARSWIIKSQLYTCSTVFCVFAPSLWVLPSLLLEIKHFICLGGGWGAASTRWFCTPKHGGHLLALQPVMPSTQTY